MDFRGKLWLRAAVMLAVVVIAAGTAVALAAGPGDAGRTGSVRTRVGFATATATASTGTGTGSIKAAAPLRLTVGGPLALATGQQAAYTLQWTAGAGAITGSGQDWGDGVGIDGSGPVGGGCSGVNVGATAVPGVGRLRAVHRWATAGTYRVRFTVSSTGCATGTAVDETATAELVVVVTGS